MNIDRMEEEYQNQQQNSTGTQQQNVQEEQSAPQPQMQQQYAQPIQQPYYPEEQHRPYDIINDPITAVRDNVDKHKVMARFITLLVSMVWTFTATSYFWSSKPVDKDIFDRISEVWVIVLCIHLLGVDSVDKIVEILKYWRTPSQGVGYGSYNSYNRTNESTNSGYNTYSNRGYSSSSYNPSTNMSNPK